MSGLSRAAADRASSLRWSEDGELQALVFELAHDAFAIEAAIVREILDVPPETAVPGARPFAATVINFRGKVIALADICIAFGTKTAEPTIDSRVVVVELDLDGEPTLIGIRADKVHEVTTLSENQCEPPPRVGMRWRPDYIECLVKQAGEFVILPDLRAIFSGDQDCAA